MGEQLISCGAEVYRVEDTLNRIGFAYGAAGMNVFVINSGMVIMIELPDGTLETQSKRMRRPAYTAGTPSCAHWA